MVSEKLDCGVQRLGVGVVHGALMVAAASPFNYLQGESSALSSILLCRASFVRLRLIDAVGMLVACQEGEEDGRRVGNVALIGTKQILAQRLP
jgi:hypothetical protein